MNDELVKRLQDEIIKTICTGLPGPNACKAPDCECYEGNGKPVFNAIKPLFAALSAQPEPVAWRWKNTNGPWQVEQRREFIPERFAKVIEPLYTAPASGVKEGMMRAAIEDEIERMRIKYINPCEYDYGVLNALTGIEQAITRAADQLLPDEFIDIAERLQERATDQVNVASPEVTARIDEAAKGGVVIAEYPAHIADQVNAEEQEQGSGATSPRADNPFAPASSAPHSASQPDGVPIHELLQSIGYNLNQFSAEAKRVLGMNESQPDMVAVPRVASAKMCQAYYDLCREQDTLSVAASDIWRAMLQAAQEAK